LDKDSGLETYLTFQDDNGLFVEVEPSSSPIDQPADKLSAWTDRDLWDFYGIHSSDITRFRDEAAVTGRKPQWATLRPQRLEKPYLFAELRRWLAPRMSQDEFNGRMAPLNYSVEQWAAHLDWISIDLVARRRLEVHERKLDHLQAQTSVEAKRPRLADEQAEIAAVPDYVTKSLENGALRDQLIEQLRSRTSTEPAVKSLEEITRQIQPYNLSTRQLSRLLDDLQADGRFPQWAEDLKHSSTDETNPNRFDEVYEELLPEIMNIRNRTTHNIDFAAHFTRPFLNALLTKAGYQRNKYNCLYRTDIPAMFRGDDRSPFEFFNGHMRPRQVHVTGSTTQKAVSATFSLSEAGVHTRVVSEVEALLYDTQHHKYPGKKPTSIQLATAKKATKVPQAVPRIATAIPIASPITVQVTRYSGTLKKTTSQEDKIRTSDLTICSIPEVLKWFQAKKTLFQCLCKNRKEARRKDHLSPRFI